MPLKLRSFKSSSCSKRRLQNHRAGLSNLQTCNSGEGTQHRLYTQLARLDGFVRLVFTQTNHSPYFCTWGWSGASLCANSGCLRSRNALTAFIPSAALILGTRTAGTTLIPGTTAALILPWSLVAINVLATVAVLDALIASVRLKSSRRNGSLPS